MKKNVAYSFGIYFVLVILLINFNNVNAKDFTQNNSTSEYQKNSEYFELTLNDILSSKYNLDSLDVNPERQKISIYIKNSLSEQDLLFIKSQIEALASAYEIYKTDQKKYDLKIVHTNGLKKNDFEIFKQTIEHNDNIIEF